MIQAVEAGIDSEPRGEQSIWREVAVFAAIGVALLCGVAFRWFDLARWSLWWDEGLTVWAAKLSPAQILTFAKSENHAPLYYLMQHWWTALFGNSEFALRALSAFFGTLASPVFYLLSKKVLQNGVATALAVWLFAFSVPQIWYSREARAYEAASFFALVALYGLTLFLEKRSAWVFLVIVLSCALTLYLHEMMFFYLLAFDLVWLAYPSERTPARRLVEMLLANLCIGLLYLPWALRLLDHVGTIRETPFWVTQPTFGKLVHALTDTAGFETAYLSDFAARFFPFSERVRSYAILSGGLLLCAGVLARSFWVVSRNDRRKNLCLLLYCLLPIFVAFLLGRSIPLYLHGVFVPSSTVFPILLAFPLVATKRSLFLDGSLGIILACTMALSGFGFIRYGEELVRNGEDWRGVTAALLTLRDESPSSIPGFNRLIVFVPPAGEVLYDYYAKYFPAIDTQVGRAGLPADFYDGFPPPEAKMTDAEDVERLRRLVKAGRYYEIVLVLTGDPDPRGLIGEYLEQDFIRQDEPVPSGPRIRIIPFNALARP